MRNFAVEKINPENQVANYVALIQPFPGRSPHFSAVTAIAQTIEALANRNTAQENMTGCRELLGFLLVSSGREERDSRIRSSYVQTRDDVRPMFVLVEAA